MPRLLFWGRQDTTQSVDGAPEITRFKILSGSIPNTFYNIISGFNDTIIFNEGASNLTATLTPGFYSTTSELTDEIKTQLDATGALTYTVTYSEITKFMAISATSTFSLIFDNSEIAETLGFEKSTVSGSSSYTGTRAVVLTPFDSILVSIRELGAADRLSGTVGRNSIHAVFPLNGYISGTNRFESENVYSTWLHVNHIHLSRMTVEVFIINSNNKLFNLPLNGGKIKIFMEIA